MAENQSTAPETKSAEATQVETESGTETSIAEQQAAELAAANDKYLRLYAEFDNYKRRVSKERIELMQTAGKEIIANLLPVIDDFDRAIKAFETATELEPLKEGVSLVGQKLKNILTQQGLKEMESIGKPFDAELQEAITNVPAPSEDLKGKVIDEIEKGYFLHGKVLRHAKVVVGS
ncbi:nucleotide exchange factor GrpE [Parapedobacter sp. GCM10030251]|uniref:nucleotide exchange factor GrpE n=1 Tax=Parapedobacter sp. GCM10030251 TaxID=3273419 RepID=UPI00361CE29E